MIIDRNVGKEAAGMRRREVLHRSARSWTMASVHAAHQSSGRPGGSGAAPAGLAVEPTRPVEATP